MAVEATRPEPGQPAGVRARRLLRRLLVPSLSDCLFVATLAVLFGASSGAWQSLLADGDTGWHLRTGEWILRTHSVPAHDLFSYSRPGAPWFAWEWLADVVFAIAYGHGGLKSVVLLSGLLICVSVLLLFRYMLWRGAGIAVALALSILVADASQIHYLARPHVFTLVLLPISLWLLDRDRKQPTPAVWLLAPISALWANLHGGFVVLIVCAGLGAAGAFFRGRITSGWPSAFAEARRPAALTGLCLLATLANPYGYQLHVHVVEYLRSGWIQRVVQEFEPPNFGFGAMYKFEIILFLGLATVPILIRVLKFEDLFAVGFWAHAALRSARHVPIYLLVATPVVGTELGRLLDRWTATAARSSFLGAAHGLVEEFSRHARRSSVWIPLVALILWLAPVGPPWPNDFPDKFPTAIITRNLATLSPAGRPGPRLLSTDEWGGYLIYRLYPALHVFMDGRSDFYGPEVGEDYICLMHGCAKWAEILDRRHFDSALLPRDWPLVELLKLRADWLVVDQDKTAILFRKIR